MRLSQEKSETTGQCFPVELLCDLLGVGRSSFYEYRRQRQAEAAGAVRPGKKSGPKPRVDDQELLQAILAVILETPFISEGVKKVHARLRYRGIKAARHRVNRLMRENGLLSPQRGDKAEENTHEGTIIPETINELWGTDGTMFGTETGDLLWLFGVIDHHSDEVLGWHIVEVGQGDRFAALEPIKQALRKIRGAVGKDVGGQIAIRHDWGPQYIARDFKNELDFLGLKNSPAMVHQPETNGIIERFFKTLKLECLWVQRFRDVQHAREVVGRWIELYNTQWLIERHGYRTPVQVRQACEAALSRVA
jgi:transposase InsO family protein